MIIKKTRTLQDHNGEIIALTIIMDDEYQTSYTIPCGKGTTMQELSDAIKEIVNK